MNIEQIEKSLMKLFNKDKYVFEKRQIVFWYDEKEDFKDEIDSLKLENIKIHKLNNNFFYTKYLLEKEDTTSNYLIYSNKAKPRLEEDWFLDIGLYSSDFSADRGSVILNDLWITDILLKDLIEKHIKFFSSKKRVTDFIYLNVNKNNKKSIELSMIASLIGSKSLNFDDILRKIFVAWLDDNKYLEEFEKFDLLDTFWEYIKENFAYKNKDKSLKNLFISFMVSNINCSWTYNLPNHLKTFEKCSDNSVTIFLGHFMNHKTDYKIYREYSNAISEELKIFKALKEWKDFDLNDIKEIDTVSAVDEFILLMIVSSIHNKKTNFEEYVDIIELRKTKHWYDEFEDQYEAILNAIEFFRFKERFENGFHEINSRELFKGYTTQYYKMDNIYRLFNFHYDKVQTKLKDNYLDKLQDEIELIYTNWFLDELTKKWISLLKTEDINNWYIDWIPRQSDFYEKEVETILSSKNTDRVFIIISDAFRYECAVDLEKLLEKEKGRTTLKSMQWVIPSYTKLGMASLLPNNEITIWEKGRIIVDWIDSGGTAWRDKILKKKNINSVAIKWQDLSSYSVTDARKLFTDKNVIYIYHNIVDTIWDKPTTEHKTFEACNDAIIELKDIVKKITNSWNWTNVLITADHGFIYKKEALVESDKISLEKISKLDNNRRFILSKDDNIIDWTINIDMWYLGNKWINAILPNGNSRFKIQWGWSNFVHGSLSLQEIVIPVINFKYMRDEKVRKEVEITLNNTSRTITSNTFSLVFYQTKPMLWKLVEWVYKISLWDFNWREPIQVSDEQKITANNTSDKVEDRTFKIALTLKSWVENWKNYRLRIISDWKNKEEKQWYDFKKDVLIDDVF